jgi:hypothetical protein
LKKSAVKKSIQMREKGIGEFKKERKNIPGA